MTWFYVTPGTLKLHSVNRIFTANIDAIGGCEINAQNAWAIFSLGVLPHETPSLLEIEYKGGVELCYPNNSFTSVCCDQNLKWSYNKFCDMKEDLPLHLHFVNYSFLYFCCLCFIKLFGIFLLHTSKIFWFLIYKVC